MRTSLTLVLLLLFAASAPTAWGQDDPGDDDRQAVDQSELVADAPGDEEVESDQGADGEGMAEPEADAARADEPPESGDVEESPADQQSLANDEDTSADMSDAGDNGEDLSEPEGGDMPADDADESAAASEADSAADEDAAGAMASGEEEEEAEDSADGEDTLDTEDAAEIADAEGQETDSAKVEGAGGNGASANQPGPAPVVAPAPGAKPAEPKIPGGTAAPWPTAKFHFMVDFGTGEIPFQEVFGLSAETLIIDEYRYGNSPTFSTINMPAGLAKSANVTLKNGIFAKDTKFWDWYNQIKMNNIKRATVTIRLLDESGAPAMTWTLTNAWPTKISSTDLKSDGNEVAVESIEIAHEGVTVTQ